MSPTTEIYPSSQVGQPIHLSLAEPDDPPERQETRDVTFYKLKGLNQPLANAHTGIVKASVLLYPPASELEVQDFDDYDYEEQDEAYYMYFDFDRRKRATKTRQETLYRRIFVSFQVNGSWQGMVSAGCYFDRSLDTIDVSLWEETNTSNPEYVLLKWKQQCSPAKADSFMANRYEVFSISDQETCDTANKRQVEIIDSQSFQPMQTSVRKSFKFACVTAFKNIMDMHKTFQYEIAQQKGSQVTKESTTGIKIGVSMAAVAVAVASLIIVRYCLKKSKHFNKLVEKTRTAAPLEMSLPQEQGSPPPTPMPCEITPDKIITNGGTGSFNTTDSGRVSDFNSGSESGSQQEGKVNRAFSMSDSENSHDHVHIHNNAGPDEAWEARTSSDHSGPSVSQGGSEGNMTGSDPWAVTSADIDGEHHIDVMQQMEAAKHGLTFAPQTSGDSWSSSEDRRETSVERDIDLKQKKAAEKAGLIMKDFSSEEEEDVSDEGRWKSEDVTSERSHSDNDTSRDTDFISLTLNPPTDHHTADFQMTGQNRGRQFRPEVCVVTMPYTNPSRNPPSSLHPPPHLLLPPNPVDTELSQSNSSNSSKSGAC